MNMEKEYLVEIEKALEEKDKEIERLNNIINKIKQRVLDETKPLPSAKEIIDIIGGIKSE